MTRGSITGLARTATDSRRSECRTTPAHLLGLVSGADFFTLCGYLALAISCLLSFPARDQLPFSTPRLRRAGADGATSAIHAARLGTFRR
jgi:hypothetical protein